MELQVSTLMITLSVVVLRLTDNFHYNSGAFQKFLDSYYHVKV